MPILELIMQITALYLPKRINRKFSCHSQDFSQAGVIILFTYCDVKYLFLLIQYTVIPCAAKFQSLEQKERGVYINCLLKQNGKITLYFLLGCIKENTFLFVLHWLFDFLKKFRPADAWACIHMLKGSPLQPARPVSRFSSSSVKSKEFSRVVNFSGKPSQRPLHKGEVSLTPLGKGAHMSLPSWAAKNPPLQNYRILCVCPIRHSYPRPGTSTWPEPTVID